MKVFVLKKNAEDSWELVGDYDMEQIPGVGDKILTRSDTGLQALPVLEVQHFFTGGSGAQGAFLHVGEGYVYSVPPEMAEFFAR